MKWTKFPVDFLSYWKRQTSKEFHYSIVNSNCAYVANIYCNWINQSNRNAIERYGFFLGEVTNPFWKKGINRHGWVEVEGEIHDPTRWCFLRTTKPMLCISPVYSEDYDVGMRKIKGITELPPFDETKKIYCDSPEVNKILNNEICPARIFWLANFNPTLIDEKDRLAIYSWLIKNKYKALIPINNIIDWQR